MTMKLKPVIRNEVPPDGYVYTHAQDGFRNFSYDEKQWLKDIQKHCVDNGYPVVDPADAYDQLCRLLPPGWCVYEDGGKPEWFVEPRMNVHDVLAGTKALIGFVASGMQVVSQELAESRSETCARCFFNVPIGGCSPCVGLADLIVSVGGDIHTRSDASLKSCAVCKCSNMAKTRLPIELIAKSTTDEQMARFPEFCWQKKEIEAQQ